MFCDPLGCQQPSLHTGSNPLNLKVWLPLPLLSLLFKFIPPLKLPRLTQNWVEFCVLSFFPQHIQVMVYVHVVSHEHVGIEKLIERWTHDRKLADSIPSRSSWRIFSLKLTCLYDSYSVSIPPVWTVTMAHKSPGHSAKCADDRLHLNTHTPLTQ